MSRILTAFHVINSPLPRCTKANVDLASEWALEPKGSATTHQTLHAIKKTGHDSMIRTSDVGWVQYSPFFHNNLPSFIMNLPSEMTLFKNLQLFRISVSTLNKHAQAYLRFNTIPQTSSTIANQCASLLPSVSEFTVQKLGSATRQWKSDEAMLLLCLASIVLH